MFAKFYIHFFVSLNDRFSPVYQTPLRAQLESPHSTKSTKSPHPSVTSTPQGTRLPGSGRKYITPKNIVNPFENGVDDLHLPAYMSPGFFTVASTPASEERVINHRMIYSC